MICKFSFFYTFSAFGSNLTCKYIKALDTTKTIVGIYDTYYGIYYVYVFEYITNNNIIAKRSQFPELSASYINNLFVIDENNIYLVG